MMILVGIIVLMLVLFGLIVLRALNQGRDVKAGLKIPFATFFFEASDHDKFSPKFSLKTPKAPSNHHG
ncbi:MAG: hypothetical protein ABSF92_03355 [Candidatus Acidiferrales bacterium]